jgi:hypothetical protein
MLMKTNNKLPICAYCVNLVLESQLRSPVSVGEPHICGKCRDYPYPDSYDKLNGYCYVWIDLITYECWADGHHCGGMNSINPNSCPNFVRSPLIFHPDRNKNENAKWMQ